MTHTSRFPIFLLLFAVGVIGFLSLSMSVFGQGTKQGVNHNPLDTFQGHPPFHVRMHKNSSPVGLTPQNIYNAYNLPGSGGAGTIAIIDAYGSPTVANDLSVFSSAFGLPSVPNCKSTTQSTCLEVHPMTKRIRSDSGWALETALDTQWAHAIAPNAHILLVEAKSASGTDLLSAVSYAASRKDVVAVSMSWGGSEFVGESSYDGYFTNGYGTTFFASSGDSGAEIEWPAVSGNVVGVGGTSLTFSNGQVSSESAWNGSGGGLSQYEPEPSYQVTYDVPQTSGMRAVPDVSFDADPSSGVAVYDSTSYQGLSGWFQVGGTSLGAPAWAAIRSLSNATVANQMFYQDALSNYSSHFRDILTGTNGTCGFFCTAEANYDYITGLGSPLTVSF